MKFLREVSESDASPARAFRFVEAAEGKGNGEGRGESESTASGTASVSVSVRLRASLIDDAGKEVEISDLL